MTVRYILIRCTPIETSTDEEEYCQVTLIFTVRCKVNLTFTVRHTQVRCTPSRGIWWPRAVLHQVIFTFGDPLGQADIQSDVPPSRDIWWPSMVLSSKVLWVKIFVICCSTIGEVSHTLQCRKMSTVFQYMLVLEN